MIVYSKNLKKYLQNQIRLVSADEIEAAEQIQNILLPIFDMLFEEPSPGPVKYLLTKTWEDVGTPLMPITDITPDLSNKILDYYKKIKKD